jgi:hypothetical protein
MIVNTSATAAEAYEKIEKTSLQNAFDAFLTKYHAATAADITSAHNVDGRNHTRLRELWMQGRVRKAGTAIAASTGMKSDLWVTVPPSEKVQAQIAYWEDYHKRLLIEANKLPSRIQEANHRLADLKALI